MVQQRLQLISSWLLWELFSDLCWEKISIWSEFWNFPIFDNFSDCLRRFKTLKNEQTSYAVWIFEECSSVLLQQWVGNENPILTFLMQSFWRFWEISIVGRMKTFKSEQRVSCCRDFWKSTAVSHELQNNPKTVGKKSNFGSFSTIQWYFSKNFPDFVTF